MYSIIGYLRVLFQLYCYLDVVTSADRKILRDWKLWGYPYIGIGLLFHKEVASGMDTTEILAGV